MPKRCNPSVITQHAWDRFMQRTGSKGPIRCLEKLWYNSQGAISIGRNRYYRRGWIYVVIQGELKTVYRPKLPEQFAAIHAAMNR